MQLESTTNGIDVESTNKTCLEHSAVFSNVTWTYHGRSISVVGSKRELHGCSKHAVATY